MAQKDFFETALLPDVNMGVTNLDAIYSWETNVWRYAQASQGFLAKALTTINFHEINSDRLGGLFKSDDKSFKTLIINQIYVDFMKAYCVSLYQGSNPSGAMVYAHQMLLKRVYVRMVMSGIETHPANITSELLQQATDMLAQSRTGNTAITNASKDYDDANVIAKQLNYLGITLTPLEIKKKQNGMATNTTTAGKIAKKAEFGEDLDQDEREKNLSIQTFLNVVTLRGIVQHDGERIVLNLVLLLMVTGFRHMEAAALRYNTPLSSLVAITQKTSAIHSRIWNALSTTPSRITHVYQMTSFIALRTPKPKLAITYLMRTCCSSFPKAVEPLNVRAR